ncbi:lipoprotein [Mycoplasmopsis californica]|uniref:Lipoprotein n=1 Tax=Mycoplasmopsis californica TaxID=2113 RepID=A0A059XSL8_9BACT|nr:hypothetical protein [Mycoplasmopsis californica]AIA29773.1 lipoprotein [Mycoplasmopsis californica]
MKKRKLSFLSLALTSVASIPLTVIACKNKEINYENIISLSAKDGSLTKDVKDVNSSDIQVTSSDKNYTAEIKNVALVNNKPGTVLVALDIKDKSGNVVLADMQKTVEGFKTTSDLSEKPKVIPPSEPEPNNPASPDADKNPETKPQNPSDSPDKFTGSDNSTSDSADVSKLRSKELYDYLKSGKKLFTFDGKQENINKLQSISKQKNNRVKIKHEYDGNTKKYTGKINVVFSNDNSQTGLTLNKDVEKIAFTNRVDKNEITLAAGSIKEGGKVNSNQYGLEVIVKEKDGIYLSFRLVNNDKTVSPDLFEELIYKFKSSEENNAPDKNSNQAQQDTPTPNNGNAGGKTEKVESAPTEKYKNEHLFQVATEKKGQIFQFSGKKADFENLIKAAKNTSNPMLKIENSRGKIKISFSWGQLKKESHGLTLIEELSNDNNVLTHTEQKRTIVPGNDDKKLGIFIEYNEREKKILLVYKLVKENNEGFSDKFQQQISMPLEEVLPAPNLKDDKNISNSTRKENRNDNALPEPEKANPKSDEAQSENIAKNNKLDNQKEQDNEMKTNQNSGNSEMNNTKGEENHQEKPNNSDGSIPKNQSDKKIMDGDDTTSKQENRLNVDYLEPEIKQQADENTFLIIGDGVTYKQLKEQLRNGDHLFIIEPKNGNSVATGKNKTKSKRINNIKLPDKLKTIFEKHKYKGLIYSASETANKPNRNKQFFDTEFNDTEKTITLKFKTPLKTPAGTLSEVITTTIKFTS